MRRRGITEAEAFATYMPGQPPVESCWDWTGYTDPNGYGRFGLNGVHIPAHVAAHRIYIGAIPDGLHVLHSCDRRICVQPRHLRVGTNADNVADRQGRDRQARGDQMGNAKLTEEDVRWLRRADLSNAEVAATLGVDRSTISVIRNRITWKHV
jgi:DNA-binding CsgD family transcriptional regulator